MRVNTGYIDADRTVYTLTRTYFVDRIEGPDANGRVKIIGKDILRFAEIEKTQMPPLPTANLTLGAPATVNFNVGMSPSGVGSTLPTLPYFMVALEEEMFYAHVSPGDVLSSDTRHEFGTLAVGHPAGTAVREAFPSQNASYKPVALIRELLLAAGIDPAYIPYSDWEAECDAHISTTAITTYFFEPESVKALVEELLADFGCALWWDELDAELKFKVITSGASAVATLTDTDHILESSMTVKTLEKERFSRVQFSYGMLKTGSGMTNLVSNLTPDPKNMGKSQLVIDTAAESLNANGGAVLKKIVSRWLGYNADTEVANIIDRYLARYSQAPREVSFKLDAKDSHHRTGDVVEIVSRLLQAPDGSQAPVKFLITQFHEVIVGTQYQYTALELPG